MLEYYTNIDTNERKNILKDEFTLDKSDYEKLKQSQNIMNYILNNIKKMRNKKK